MEKDSQIALAICLVCSFPHSLFSCLFSSCVKVTVKKEKKKKKKRNTEKNLITVI